MSNDFATDIPQRTAYEAHHGTSFVPEKRAASEREGYAAGLTADYEYFRQVAEKNGTLDLLGDEFDRYRQGVKRRTLAYLQSRSRLVSVMIAGGSKFPAARMNKRGEVSHKRLTELLEFQARAKKAILRKLCPSAGPIKSGDADAIDRLEAEIRQAERLQEAMKQGNVIVRQKPKNESTPEKLAELMTLGLSERRAREMFEPDFCGRLGFPDYRLTNNGANIRRMKKRLEQISKAKATETTETKGENATVENNPAENRVRLFFGGKPAEDIRTRLKSSGFRWTPSLGCWQAYPNSRTIAIAREVAGID